MKTPSSNPGLRANRRIPRGSGRVFLLFWLALTQGCLGLSRNPAGNKAMFSADAAWLHEHALLQQVRLAPDGSALELEHGKLIEDDGPAAGYSYQPNTERLADNLRIRKQLEVPHPAARAAWLLVGPGGNLELELNGRNVPLTPQGKVGGYWQSYTFNPGALRVGLNDFVLKGTGAIWIARVDEYTAGADPDRKPPNRSARSTDGGHTWNDERLGTDGNVDGEYYVRLFLEHYRRQGCVTLPVMDIGNLAQRPVASALHTPGPIQIRTEIADYGTVEMRVRTGSSASVDSRHWTDWSALPPDGSLEQPSGRYFQLELVLKTDDPLRSPQLRGITIRSRAAETLPDWTDRLKLSATGNRRISRTPVPFRYEPFDHPRLEQLRSQYQLDEVVKGAESEFDLILKLAAWTADRDGIGIQDGYPPWDALEILKLDGRHPGAQGFCQAYNLVFLQACESFGLCGRVVSLGPADLVERIRSGHEVTEIWSNEYAKWIYVDGQAAWYAVDAASGIPLSLLELRERQLDLLEGRQPPPTLRILLETTRERRWQWPGLDSWPAFAELRLIPRSNFLAEAAPLPLNQGMRGWFWTGHYIWEDGRQTFNPLYSKRLYRRKDFDWDLNRTQMTFEADAEPGLLRVHLDSETPGFESFQAEFDAEPPRRVASTFSWRLNPGHNRLRVHSVNHVGRRGVPATAEIDYNPPGN